MGSNNLKGYDGMQVLRSVFDVDQNCLRVCIVDGSGASGSNALEVVIDHTTDSIRLGDGTNLVSLTPINGKVGLDVNIVNPEQSVTNDGQGNPITSTQTDTSKRALDVVSLNELVPREFDDVEVTAVNADGCPTSVLYRSGGIVVATLTVTYDANGNFQRVMRA